MLEAVTILLAFSVGLVCGSALKRAPPRIHTHLYIVAKKPDEVDEADWWKDDADS